MPLHPNASTLKVARIKNPRPEAIVIAEVSAHTPFIVLGHDEGRIGVPPSSHALEKDVEILQKVVVVVLGELCEACTASMLINSQGQQNIRRGTPWPGKLRLLQRGWSSPPE